MIDYRVIEKNEIPPPSRHHSGYYGEWKALMALLRILEPDKAIELRASEIAVHSSLSALYSAAYAAGLRISVQANQETVYIVRRGKPGPAPAPKPKFVCACCREKVQRQHPKQEFCQKKECQLDRKRRNNREWYEANRRRVAA